jgi:H+/gluconate symporter-like permease
MSGALVCLVALLFLMFAAYRGHSVIVFAPIAALGAVLLTLPSAVLPVYSGLFMDSMAAFLRNYFPIFMLSAIFGKVIELSGAARSISMTISRLTGPTRTMLAVVIVCALLVYGGVAVFVVPFAVYPVAAVMFRENDIPKRLLPATLALGSFTFAMDALPGSPQVQNIIPTTFFGTTTTAAPRLGLLGAAVICGAGMIYLEWRRRAASAAGEGYGVGHLNEPAELAAEELPHPVVAFAPLVVVAVTNIVLARFLPVWYGSTSTVLLAPTGRPVVQQVASFVGVWSVEAALVLGILAVLLPAAFRRKAGLFAASTRMAMPNCLLAVANVGSEFGFGAVIAALPGFFRIQAVLSEISNPLVSVAISITTLAGITGSAAGGISIALGAMAAQFKAAALDANIPLEVLHRISAMAAGGMDTLPHNGAVVALLAITGMTHKQAYGDIFVMTCLKTAAVFVIILAYSSFGIV